MFFYSFLNFLEQNPSFATEDDALVGILISDEEEQGREDEESDFALASENANTLLKRLHDKKEEGGYALKKGFVRFYGVLPDSKKARQRYIPLINQTGGFYEKISNIEKNEEGLQFSHDIFSQIGRNIKTLVINPILWPNHRPILQTLRILHKGIPIPQEDNWRYIQNNNTIEFYNLTDYDDNLHVIVEYERES